VLCRNSPNLASQKYTPLAPDPIHSKQVVPPSRGPSCFDCGHRLDAPSLVKRRTEPDDVVRPLHPQCIRFPATRVPDGPPNKIQGKTPLIRKLPALIEEAPTRKYVPQSGYV